MKFPRFFPGYPVVKSIRSALIVALFFLSPLIFSHLPKLIGIPYSFADFWNFEEPKRIFIWILTGLIILRIPKSSSLAFSRAALRIYTVSALFLGIAIVQALYYGTWITTVFIDALETFSPVFWLLFLLLGNEMLHFSAEDLRLARCAILASLFPVGLYAVLQIFWLDPFSYSTTFGENRVFSMFGNPNSLAGFCILLLPLLHEKTFLQKNATRTWVALIVFIILLMTHSLSGILLASAYLLWISWIGKKISWIWKILVFVGIFSWICMLGFSFFPEYAHEKFLSIATRIALFANGVSAIVNHPEILVFGSDQKNLLVFLNIESLPIVRQYVSPDIVIPSSHFFLLDIILENGILPYFAGLLLYAGVGNRRDLSNLSIAPILLFLLFFSFHSPSVIHLLLLALCIYTWWAPRDEEFFANKR